MAAKTQFDDIPHKDYGKDPIGQFFTLSEIFYRDTLGPKLKKDLKEALDERDDILLGRICKIENGMTYTRVVVATLFVLMFFLVSC